VVVAVLPAAAQVVVVVAPLHKLIPQQQQR